MKLKFIGFLLALSEVIFLPGCLRAAPGLVVTYGGAGIQQVSYNGITLEDLGAFPSDAFHIAHMKATDLQGNLKTDGQYTWGEVNNGRSWDPGSNTWTYRFVWGSISVQFAQSGDTLNMNVTAVNNANSGVIFDGAAIYPFELHFPQLPVGFNDPSYEQLAFNTTGPSVTTANYGSGEVIAVDTDTNKPLYSGFQPAGGGNNYYPIISGTPFDGMATFFPQNDRPVSPGQTDSFTVSLRFAPSGTASAGLVADVYQSWAKSWPAQLNWTDRRIIGTVYLSSPGSGNVNQAVGFPNNPRRYFNDSSANDFDVTNAAGLAKFQARILQQAASNVANLQKLGAQGAITWDVEGQQYPQSTSYVCSPDQIAQVAPEMESVITDPSSPYVGMKLDDAYFKTMTGAGFRIGVCIRPQQFTLYGDGTAAQVTLPDAQIPAQLIRKMKYAHDRWGVTLFYVDSTVEANGGTLDAGIFQQVQAALPDSLIIPEETTPKYYAYTAAFETFIFHTDTGTPADVYNYYPKAFSAILVNDVDAAKLAQYRPQLTASVGRGDVLMVHADYWQDNNPTVVQMYKDAGVSSGSGSSSDGGSGSSSGSGSSGSGSGSSSGSGSGSSGSGSASSLPPTSSNIAIVAPATGSTISGAVSITGSVNLALDAAGTHLLVDGVQAGGNVNASPFVYALNTALFSDGTHTLQLWGHDISNNTDISDPVTVTISNSQSSGGSNTSSGGSGPSDSGSGSAGSGTSSASSSGSSSSSGGSSGSGSSSGSSSSANLAILSPSAGGTVSGSISVIGSVNLALDAAGTHLLIDGAQAGNSASSAPFVYSLNTTLYADGSHTLQLWAHDIGNNTTITDPITITISNGQAGSSSTPASSSAASTSGSYAISLTSPASGQQVSGTIFVGASISQTLSSAGSYLMVDGAVAANRVVSGPFLYTLDTTTLSSGQHTLQVAAIDIGNNHLLSNPVSVIVSN